VIRAWRIRMLCCITIMTDTLYIALTSYCNINWAIVSVHKNVHISTDKNFREQNLFTGIFIVNFNLETEEYLRISVYFFPAKDTFFIRIHFCQTFVKDPFFQIFAKQGCGSGLTSIRIRIRIQNFSSIQIRIRTWIHKMM
jgi:hypothetical protein